MRQTKHKLLLDTAYRLFNRYGYHATGIDFIIKESGVSKATLYKYFKTKDVLILEVLKYRHDAFLQDINQTLQQRNDEEEPILAIFDVYTDWFNQSDFNGCFFTKAGGEFSQQESPINQMVYKVKNDLKKLLIRCLKTKERSLKSAEEIAAKMMLLLDGAVVDAQISRNKEAAKHAKGMATQLLVKA